MSCAKMTIEASILSVKTMDDLNYGCDAMCDLSEMSARNDDPMYSKKV
jgi:hypothetical protein